MQCRFSHIATDEQYFLVIHGKNGSQVGGSKGLDLPADAGGNHNHFLMVVAEHELQVGPDPSQ